MNSESLSTVFERATRTHGSAMVHLLVSWLKCARILIADSSPISSEILLQIQSRAFLKIEKNQFEMMAEQLGKNDLLILSSPGKVDLSWSAKIVGFGENQQSLDGLFSGKLDASAAVYFDQALAAFSGNLNDLLTPTKYLFLDRDGVIIEYVSYIQDSAQVKLRPGIAEVIAKYRQLGHRVVMVTNQSGVARGYSSQEDFRQVQNRTLELLAQQGQWIDACYFATYMDGSLVPQTLQYPSLRKPKAGMFAEEAQFWNIDAENSVMIGDNASDVEWAQNAGIGKVFWLDNPDLREKSPSQMNNVIQVLSLDQILTKI